MAEISEMSLEELEIELARKKALLEDILFERSFMGKQTGMHISPEKFKILDNEAEAAGKKIKAIEQAIAVKLGTSETS